MTQGADGSWGGSSPVGFAALPGLTLLECGVPANDPVVQKAADYVRTHCLNVTDHYKTYQWSLALLFLDRLGESRDWDLIRTLALSLVAEQTVSGGWGYGGALLNPQQRDEVAGILNELRDKPVAEVRASYPTWKNRLAVLQDVDDRQFASWQGDNSNTQFAILALWAARRHQIPLERTAERILKRYHRTQAADGSWTYVPGQNVSPQPTMTCAALLGLAVGHAVENEATKRQETIDKDPSVQKGFERLAQNLGKPTGTDQRVPLTDLYFLWSVERVAVIYQRPQIEGKDWYGWGSEMLVGNQQEDGHWQGGNYPGTNPIIDTSFALLFLRQANLAKDLTSKLQLRGEGR
jgi:hypothetical protein